MNPKLIDMDAWSDGQVQSKMWLCQELEKIPQAGQIRHVWIYGAWYGLLSQFLLIRDRLKIEKFQLFDLDEEALRIAKDFSMTWWLNGKQFEFHHLDCGLITKEKIQVEKPDLIINTSCEHFKNHDWFDNLPSGQLYLAQSTDLVHPTHILPAKNLNDFKSQLSGIKDTFYEDVLPFKYPHFSFNRYMIIGKK